MVSMVDCRFFDHCILGSVSLERNIQNWTKLAVNDSEEVAVCLEQEVCPSDTPVKRSLGTKVWPIISILHYI